MSRKSNEASKTHRIIRRNVERKAILFAETLNCLDLGNVNLRSMTDTHWNQLAAIVSCQAEKDVPVPHNGTRELAIDYVESGKLHFFAARRLAKLLASELRVRV